MSRPRERYRVPARPAIVETPRRELAPASDPRYGALRPMSVADDAWLAAIDGARRLGFGLLA